MKEVMAAHGPREAGEPRELYVSDPAEVARSGGLRDDDRLADRTGGELGTPSDRFERGAD